MLLCRYFNPWLYIKGTVVASTSSQWFEEDRPEKSFNVGL